MTAFIVGLSMMILPPIILAGIHLVLSKAVAKQPKTDDGFDAGFIFLIVVVVAIILIYFGYGIMDRAVVEMGWWVA